MQSPLYLLLSALPMAVCFFWTVTYLIKYKKARTSQRILFWFMLTATLLYFAHFIFFNKIYSMFPVTDTIYNFATAAVYPLYFIYIISLTEGISKKDWCILIPSASLALFIGILYVLMPEPVLKEFILGYEYNTGAVPEALTAQLSKLAHNIVKIVFAIQLIPILYFGLKKLDRFKKNIEEYWSGSENERIRDLRILLIFFVVTSVASATANLIGRTFFTDSTFMVAIPAILFSVLLYAVGYAGSVQTVTVEDLMAEKPDTSDIPGDTENQEKEKPCISKADIDRIMENDHLYLDPQLKLSDVAEHLNTNRTYVYNALKADNNGESQSFSDYVNHYRISHALQLLESQEKPNCIEDIIYESGFQSKTTFYSNFKKMTGMTPKAYQERNQAARL